MKKIKYAGIMLSLLFIICSGPGGSPVLANEEETIRVAFPIQEGMTFKDENGYYSGYTYEYLMTLSQFGGFEYELVEVPGDIDTQLTTLMEMLEHGEVDLMGSMAYSDELAQTYDYVMNNYGTYSKVLCTLDTNTDLNSVSIYTMDKLRVAIYSTQHKSNEELLTYAKSSGFEIEEIFVDSVQEQMEALVRGEADVLLTNDLAVPEEYFDRLRIVYEFDTRPFYFAATKGNKELVNRVNSAISSVNAADPYYAAALKRKYFENKSQKITLTKKEKEYIKSLKPLKVLVFGGRAPINDTDYQGEPHGIALDILKYIAEEAGISLQFETVENYKEYERAVQNGEPDLLICNNQYSAVLNTRNYNMSIPCISSPLMVVIHNSQNFTGLKGKRLAMPKGIRYQGDTEGEVIYFENVADCLEAVNEGKADYCYANAFTVQYYTNHNKYHNIYSLQQGEEWVQKYSLGINRNLGKMLQVVLNKSIQNISEEQLLQMYLYVNGTEDREITFLEYFNKNRTEAVLACLALAAALTSGGLLWKRRVEKKTRKELILQAERDGLTGAYNNAAMREKTVLLLKSMECGQERALIILDLDNFKGINDTYGHYIGDQALKRVMEACRRIFREGELIGRIGGDEFAIFAGGNVSQDSLNVKCRQLREILLDTKLSEVELKITLSVGGVISKELNSYDDLFKVADRVMYEVKKNGRDGSLFERV